MDRQDMLSRFPNAAARSPRDFARKLQIAIKEPRETDFGVRLIALSGMIREGRLRNFREEVSAVTAICVAAVKTLKSRKGSR
jgi:four helix bundle protein